MYSVFINWSEQYLSRRFLLTQKGWLCFGVIVGVLVALEVMFSILAGPHERYFPKRNLILPPLKESQLTGDAGHPSGSNPINLTILSGEHEFVSGRPSETMGINQNYMGPTIRLQNHTDVRFVITNTLDQPISFYQHGIHAPGEMVGCGKDMIKANGTAQLTLEIEQPASMGWYYVCSSEVRAPYVYDGLMGLYIIEDENSKNLGLPHTYGVDDIPLVIQSPGFRRGVLLSYETMQTREELDLLVLRKLIVNGGAHSYKEVGPGWVRLRLLNASSENIYRFFFRDERTLYKIATDGGFLEQPIPLTEITMMPGQRQEILVDFSSKKDAELLAQITSPYEEAEHRVFSRAWFWDKWLSRKWFFRNYHVVNFSVNPDIPALTSKPYHLIKPELYSQRDVQYVRTFELEHHSDHEELSFYINSSGYDRTHVNESLSMKRVELWRLRSKDLEYPFHISGTSFSILSQNGEPPSPEDRGWHDVVIVSPEGWTEILVRFDFPASEEYPYRYFTSVLELSDRGMMGQVSVSP